MNLYTNVLHHNNDQRSYVTLYVDEVGYENSPSSQGYIKIWVIYYYIVLLNYREIFLKW